MPCLCLKSYSLGNNQIVSYTQGQISFLWTSHLWEGAKVSGILEKTWVLTTSNSFLFILFFWWRDWPWANICCQSSSSLAWGRLSLSQHLCQSSSTFYVGCLHSMADEWSRSMPRIWTREPRLPKQSTWNFNHSAMGLAPTPVFLWCRCHREMSLLHDYFLRWLVQ